MEKLLITGINGFVGSELAAFFKDCYEVWGLDLKNVSNRENFISADITSFEKLSKDLEAFSFDYIIHCAAIAHNDKNQFNFNDFDRVNAQGTYNLLKVLEKNPPKKFILFSTVAVYGEFGTKSQVDESFPINPITDYALSKVKAESFCNANQKINTIVLRFPAIYSEHLLKDFSKRILLKGKIAFHFGSGEQKHTFCHLNSVKEQVSFILLAQNIHNKTFQMGDSFNYSSSEIMKYFKNDIKFVFPFPKWVFKTLLNLLLLIYPKRKNTLYSIYWKLFENNLYSIKILLDLGFQPTINKII